MTNPKSIYLIKKLWIDPLENVDAWGYEPVGYVTMKSIAEMICASTVRRRDRHPWPLDYVPGPDPDFVPVYIYEEISPFEFEDGI